MFDDVKGDPNISVVGMSKILMRKFNLKKKHNTIWRAKVKILRLIKGKDEDGFNLLARYTEMIKSSNPVVIFPPVTRATQVQAPAMTPKTYYIKIYCKHMVKL